MNWTEKWIAQISFEEGNVSFFFFHPATSTVNNSAELLFLFVSANNLNVFRKSTPDFTTAQPPPSLTQSYFPIFVSLDKVGRFERGLNGPARTLCKMESPRMYRRVSLFPLLKRKSEEVVTKVMSVMPSDAIHVDLTFCTFFDNVIFLGLVWFLSRSSRYHVTYVIYLCSFISSL